MRGSAIDQQRLQRVEEKSRRNAVALLGLAAAAKLGTTHGLQIASVVAGSPAAQAGLRRGDIVVTVDGRNVVTATAIQQLMVEDAIARRIEMTVWRNGALVDVFVTPRELADR